MRDDAIGLNLLGILLERQNLRSAAVAAFRSALDLEPDADRKRPIARNLARVLHNTEEVTSLLHRYKSGSFDEFCSEGFILAKHHQYDEALAAYESALPLAPPHLTSHVLAAMGVVQWARDARGAQRLGRNVDVNTAKGILFKWCVTACMIFFIMWLG